MKTPTRPPLNFLLAALIFCAVIRAEEAPKPPVKPAPANTQIAPAKSPLKLADGPSRAGWDALVKNDFVSAEKEFNAVLTANPTDLFALEGLRWTCTSLGRYRDAQDLNFRLVKASAKDSTCHSHIFRSIEALSFVESRAEMAAAFGQALPNASPQVAQHLRDQLSYLDFQAGRYEAARKQLDGLGYIGRWVFAAGPFGEKDRNNTIEKRFAPERAITSLDFKDERGTPVKVVRDAANLDRDLDLDMLFEGTRGVYYILANLQSDAARDAVLFISAPAVYRAFLRGLPIASQPDDEAFGRTAGQMYRVRLEKGSNPLLFKLGALGRLSVRVAGDDYGPLAGVTAAGMSDKELSVLETSSARGFLLGERATGGAALWFLNKFDKFGRHADGVNVLRAIVDSVQLTLPEAVWLQLVLQRENDQGSIEALARRIIGSFPDSIAALDLGASMLGSSGRALGNNEARENEDAKRLRERALKIVPTSHQHLVALADFYSNNELRDQAFELIKKCAEAHPNSAFVQAELGRHYESKSFQIEAERCFENAAKLDASQIPVLAGFHQSYGSRARAKELIEKQRELGMLNPDAQYTQALRREDFAEAARLLDAEEKWFPERKEYFAASRAKLLQAKGDLAGAYAIQKALFDSLAGHPARNKHLSPLVDLALRMGREDEAKTLLAAHLAKHPNDFDARRRLANFDSAGEKHWWESFDVNVADIDTSKFTSQKYPTANHAWLVDLMVAKILPDMSTESYTHVAQKVLTLKGIGELSEVMTRAKSKDIVFIRTLNPDGSTYVPQNVHDFQLEQSASLYKVGPGSILERAYIEQSAADEDEPRVNMAFNFNAIDAPRAVSRWVVLIADELKDKLDIQRVRPELLEEKIFPGPKGFTVYQWTNKQIEGIKGERMMPRETDRESIPVVTIETKQNPIRANSLLMRRELDRIPEAAKIKAREIAKEITALPGSKGREQEAQFESIILWVRNNIEAGNDSRTYDDVWGSRTGSAAQMTVLAREMCQAAGLDVASAYLNGAYLPGKAWVSKNARRVWEPTQLSGFGTGGQMLTFAPARGLDMWAQFNPGRRAKFYSPFDVGPAQPGALAFVIADSGARVKRVMADKMGSAQYRETTKINLADDGVATVHTNLLFVGLQAGIVREALSNPQQRDPLRDSITRRTWPQFKTLAYEILGEENAGQPLLVNYSGRISPLAEKAGGALYLQAFPDAPRMTSLRGPAARESDLILRDENLLSEFDRALQFTAPEGYAWTEIPDDIFICNEFGFYMADFNVKGRVLYCTRASLFPSQRVTPEKHAEFQKFIAKVIQHHAQRIACAPLNAESFGGKKKEIFSGGYSTSQE